MVVRAMRADQARRDLFASDARAIPDGVLIGAARTSSGDEIAIRLPWPAAAGHLVVQGASGAGKTMFVASLFRELLTRGEACGLVDLKGELFDLGVRLRAALAYREAEPTRRILRERTAILNFFNASGRTLVPFNVCRPVAGWSRTVQAYEIALGISRLFDVALSHHQESCLRHALMLAMEADLSLIEVPRLLADPILRGLLLNRSRDTQLKHFFERTFADDIPEISKQTLRARLESLFLSEETRLVLGADGMLDLRDVFDRGDFLAVYLGKSGDAPEELVDTLGNLFVQVALRNIYSRRHRAPYLLLLDEPFHLFEAPGLAARFMTAVTTTRSYGVHFAFVNHVWAQLPPALRETLLGTVQYAALFRTSGRNAAFFGDFLPEEAADEPSQGRRARVFEALQRLPNRTAFWYDRTKPYRAIEVRVPDQAPPHAVAGITEQELDRFVRDEGWSEGGAGVPRDNLRAQLAEREERLNALVRGSLRPPRASRAARPDGRPPLG